MILFGCQDVGPAKYLSKLSDHALLKGSQWIGGELSIPVFKKNHLDCTDDIKIHPSVNLVVTGTTLGDGLDKQLLKLAKCKGIPTISIIEHWNWYKKRFQLDGGLVFPDHIFLNDKIAYDEAVTEGLPKKSLIIVGNPILESMGDAHLLTHRRTSKIIDAFKFPKKGRRLLFISEQLRKDFAGNDELGYDEYEVFKTIKKFVEKEDLLIVKKHPAEEGNKYRQICSDYVELDDVETSHLSAISDVIIGMGSMLLLELAAFRGDVISYRPNYKGSDFIGSRLGVVNSVYTEDDLMWSIKNNRYIKQSMLQNLFQGSKDRIVNNIVRFAS